MLTDSIKIFKAPLHTGLLYLVRWLCHLNITDLTVGSALIATLNHSYGAFSNHHATDTISQIIGTLITSALWQDSEMTGHDTLHSIIKISPEAIVQHLWLCLSASSLNLCLSPDLCSPSQTRLTLHSSSVWIVLQLKQWPAASGHWSQLLNCHASVVLLVLLWLFVSSQKYQWVVVNSALVC